MPGNRPGVSFPDPGATTRRPDNVTSVAVGAAAGALRRSRRPRLAARPQPRSFTAGRRHAETLSRAVAWLRHGAGLNSGSAPRTYRHDSPIMRITGGAFAGTPRSGVEAGGYNPDNRRDVTSPTGSRNCPAGPDGRFRARRRLAVPHWKRNNPNRVRAWLGGPRLIPARREPVRPGSREKASPPVVKERRGWLRRG
jgi:hypothetical protein